MINTILIPIITAYYVKDQNFYYENGLVDNIFMLSISTIVVPAPDLQGIYPEARVGLVADRPNNLRW